MFRRRTTLVMALLLALGTNGVASGHRLATSRGQWEVDVATATVTAAVTLDVTAVQAVSGVRPPESPAARPAWRHRQKARVLQGFARTVSVRLEGASCVAEGLGLEGERGEDLIVFRLRWTCPRTGGELRLRLPFIEKIAEDHTHIADFGADNVVLLTVEEPEYRLRMAPAAGTSSSSPPQAAAVEPASNPPRKLDFGGMVWLGLDHIATGWDHILFLLALLLVVGRLGQAMVIVTAFTVAHSVTLALSVLDVVVLPDTLVEAGIAATIVFVAVENVWRPKVKHRWAWALGFGLVHGLGFAGYLKEQELFADGILIPLLGFNLGVEAGQLAIAVVAIPLLLLGATRVGEQRWRHVVAAASVVIGAVGLYWLVERALL